MTTIELTEDRIDCERLLSYVNDPYCGAEVLFVGTTRRWTDTATNQIAEPSVDMDQPLDVQRQPVETSHLIYEAYREMALKQMQALADEAQRRWPVRRVAMIHRLGRVEPTEPSVAIAVSCPHRSEAFAAAQWLIDELKHQVPIWKQEHYVQSGAEWIHPTSGSCRCLPHPSQTLESTAGRRSADPNSATDEPQPPEIDNSPQPTTGHVTEALRR